MPVLASALRVDDDALTDGEAGDLLADSGNLAGAVSAENPRHLLRGYLGSARSGARVEVQPVQGGRSHAHHYFIGAGYRVGQIAVLQGRWFAVLPDEYCFHALSSFSFPTT